MKHDGQWRAPYMSQRCPSWWDTSGGASAGPASSDWEPTHLHSHNDDDAISRGVRWGACAARRANKIVYLNMRKSRYSGLCFSGMFMHLPHLDFIFFKYPSLEHNETFAAQELNSSHSFCPLPALLFAGNQGSEVHVWNVQQTCQPSALWSGCLMECSWASSALCWKDLWIQTYILSSSEQFLYGNALSRSGSIQECYSLLWPEWIAASYGLVAAPAIWKYFWIKLRTRSICVESFYWCVLRSWG